MTTGVNDFGKAIDNFINNNSANFRRFFDDSDELLEALRLGLKQVVNTTENISDASTLFRNVEFKDQAIIGLADRISNIRSPTDVAADELTAIRSMTDFEPFKLNGVNMPRVQRNINESLVTIKYDRLKNSEFLRNGLGNAHEQFRSDWGEQAYIKFNFNPYVADISKVNFARGANQAGVSGLNNFTEEGAVAASRIGGETNRVVSENFAQKLVEKLDELSQNINDFGKKVDDVKANKAGVNPNDVVPAWRRRPDGSRMEIMEAINVNSRALFTNPFTLIGLFFIVMRWGPGWVQHFVDKILGDNEDEMQATCMNNCLPRDWWDYKQAEQGGQLDILAENANPEFMSISKIRELQLDTYASIGEPKDENDYIVEPKDWDWDVQPFCKINQAANCYSFCQTTCGEAYTDSSLLADALRGLGNAAGEGVAAVAEGAGDAVGTFANNFFEAIGLGNLSDFSRKLLVGGFSVFILGLIVFLILKK